jgi:hypothetical protein
MPGFEKFNWRNPHTRPAWYDSPIDHPVPCNAQSADVPERESDYHFTDKNLDFVTAQPVHLQTLQLTDSGLTVLGISRT